MSDEYLETCNCMLCGKEIKVSFPLPPSEEEKEGWLCSKCEKEIEKE